MTDSRNEGARETGATTPADDAQVARALERGCVVFYVVRHGKTEFNEQHRVQGWSNAPLTPEGEAVARAVGRGLAGVPFARAYASDLGRARQTLALLLESWNEPRAADGGTVPAGASKLPTAYDERLREWCYGDLEGQPGTLMRARFARGFGEDLTLAELNERLPEVADVLARADETGRAERFPDIAARLRSFFIEAGTRQLEQGGGAVLAVTHSFAMRTIVYLIDKSRVNDPLKYENAAVTRVIYDGKRFSLADIASLTWLERGSASAR